MYKSHVICNVPPERTAQLVARVDPQNGGSEECTTCCDKYNLVTILLIKYFNLKAIVSLLLFLKKTVFQFCMHVRHIQYFFKLLYLDAE